MGLRRGMIIRDGNCLFRALAHALLGDQDGHSEVRKTVCDTMEKNWWLFQAILVDQSKEAYLENMLKPGTYGGEPEIQAACYAYHCQTRLYLGGLNYPIMCRTYGNSSASQMVLLSYVSDGLYDSGHYDLIVESLEEMTKVETTYNAWRVGRVEDYNTSERVTDNAVYGEASNTEVSLLKSI